MRYNTMKWIITEIVTCSCLLFYEGANAQNPENPFSKIGFEGFGEREGRIFRKRNQQPLATSSQRNQSESTHVVFRGKKSQENVNDMNRRSMSVKGLVGKEARSKERSFIRTNVNNYPTGESTIVPAFNNDRSRRKRKGKIKRKKYRKGKSMKRMKKKENIEVPIKLLQTKENANGSSKENDKPSKIGVFTIKREGTIFAPPNSKQNSQKPPHISEIRNKAREEGILGWKKTNKAEVISQSPQFKTFPLNKEGEGNGFPPYFESSYRPTFVPAPYSIPAAPTFALVDTPVPIYHPGQVISGANLFRLYSLAHELHNPWIIVDDVTTYRPPNYAKQTLMSKNGKNQVVMKRIGNLPQDEEEEGYEAIQIPSSETKSSSVLDHKELNPIDRDSTLFYDDSFNKMGKYKLGEIYKLPEGINLSRRIFPAEPTDRNFLVGLQEGILLNSAGGTLKQEPILAAPLNLVKNEPALKPLYVKNKKTFQDAKIHNISTNFLNTGSSEKMKIGLNFAKELSPGMMLAALQPDPKSSFVSPTFSEAPTKKHLDNLTPSFSATSPSSKSFKVEEIKSSDKEEKGKYGRGEEKQEGKRKYEEEFPNRLGGKSKENGYREFERKRGQMESPKVAKTTFPRDHIWGLEEEEEKKPIKSTSDINGKRNGIPKLGYPTLSFIPKTSFNCIRRLTGYYADPEAECQVFHICHSRGRLDSFLCPNSTLFNQKILTCDFHYNVNCEDAEQYYEINRLLFDNPGRELESEAQGKRHQENLKPINLTQYINNLKSLWTPYAVLQ